MDADDDIEVGPVGIMLDEALHALVAAGQCKVPPYPAVALKLARLVETGVYDLSQLAQVAQADQALAASVLQCANSAFYGAMQPVMSLPAAIGRLGSMELVRVAMAAALGQRATEPGPLISLRRLTWQNAVAAAMLSRHLARQVGARPDDAFMAGLLHDFGYIIAIGALEELLQQHEELHAMPQLFWLELIEKHHVGFGVALAQQWKLPATLLEIIASHHDMASASAVVKPYVQLTQASDAINALLARSPFVTLQDLAGIPLLQTEAAGLALMEVLPQIPTVIESFSSQAVTPQKAKAVVIASKVLPAASLLGQNCWPARRELEVTWKGQKLCYLTSEISTAGVRMAGDEALPENHLLHLTFHDPQGDLKLWGTVWSCGGIKKPFTVEIKFMAMSGSAADTWNAWVKGVRGPSAPAQGKAAPAP